MNLCYNLISDKAYGKLKKQKGGGYAYNFSSL